MTSLKNDASEQSESRVSRRDFLGLSTIAAFAGSVLLFLVGLVRFPKPALFPEVSETFKLGKPEDFPVGTHKVLPEKRLVVARDDSGFYAISTVCTHLGCLVAETADGFLCPCHGSRFASDGKVIHGPAPKDLNWLEISQLPNGVLSVDMSRTVPLGSRFLV